MVSQNNLKEAVSSLILVYLSNAEEPPHRFQEAVSEDEATLEHSMRWDIHR